MNSPILQPSAVVASPSAPESPSLGQVLSSVWKIPAVSFWYSITWMGTLWIILSQLERACFMYQLWAAPRVVDAPLLAQSSPDLIWMVNFWTVWGLWVPMVFLLFFSGWFLMAATQAARSADPSKKELDYPKGTVLLLCLFVLSLAFGAGLSVTWSFLVG